MWLPLPRDQNLGIVTSNTYWANGQNKFNFKLHKIFGKLKSNKLSPYLSRTEIKITYLRNINYFYTTLQNDDYESVLIEQGYIRAFYLVNDVIKACEIDDLFRWKTWFQKWRILCLLCSRIVVNITESKRFSYTTRFNPPFSI